MSETSARTIGAIKVVGLVLAVIIALTQLRDWFSAPSADLAAEITYGSFQLPPGLSAEIEGLHTLSEKSLLREKLSLSSAFDFIEDDRTRERAEELALTRMSWFLRDALPYTVPDPYRSIRGYWSVVLSNEGSTTLESVALTLPEAIYTTVIREGEPTKYGPSAPVIRFESMQPRESIEIYAWAATTPQRYHDVDVKLVHSAGVGAISFRAPVAPFWVFLDQYWPVFAFPLGWILPMAVVFGVWAFRAQGTRREPDTGPDEPDKGKTNT